MACAGREPCDRPRRAMAAGAAPRLLHDRLGRARVQRATSRWGCARATRPSFTTARARSTSRERRRRGATASRTSCAAMAAAAEEPIAGGRHKVFGHHELAIIPQTSTIASHLPRAVGVAFAIERARRLGVESAWAAGRDRRVLVRRRVARTTRRRRLRSNAASFLAYQRPADAAALRLRGQRPRDQRADARGVGRAVAPRPARARGTSGVDGDDPAAVLETARELAEWVREHRRPAVLHLRTVRFLSHAGADVETAYRTRPGDQGRLRARPVARDGPLARVGGGRSGEELAEEYLAIARARPRARARRRRERPQLAQRARTSSARSRRARRPRSRRSSASAVAGGGERADARAGDQRRARHRARRAPRGARLRRGRRPSRAASTA